jgi:hypothetical protein
MKKILLLSMPLGALERPPLRTQPVRGRFQEVCIGCDIHCLLFYLYRVRRLELDYRYLWQARSY